MKYDSYTDYVNSVLLDSAHLQRSRLESEQSNPVGS